MPANAKETVRHLLDGLPDDATFEQIRYRIYVQERIERGLADLERGRTLSMGEVEGRMARWLDE